MRSSYRPLCLSVQYSDVKKKHPEFETRISATMIKVNGEIKPTPRSIPYSFQINYSNTNKPNIKIIKPELVKNYKNEPIPHIYPGNKLCLYHPKYREFTKGMFLTDTVIPWITLWLYYYEIWHTKGEWLGGGEHPK